jgi:hypothetical protein
MKNFITNRRQIARGILLTACTMALGVASMAQVQASDGDDTGRVTPPRVPANLEVEAGNKAFLVGHAIGTQNYVCVPSGTGVAWTLFTPQATLFTARGKQLTTHFFSPNPEEKGLVRAAWQDSRDTSTVWGGVVDSSTDAQFVRKGAIPWLLIKEVGTQEGPAGGDRLTKTTFIHRVNTVGGAAPITGCASPADIGSKAFVPYTADYFFYEKSTRDVVAN